jgi:hypothetical protein
VRALNVLYVDGAARARRVQLEAAGPLHAQVLHCAVQKHS